MRKQHRPRRPVIAERLTAEETDQEVRKKCRKPQAASRCAAPAGIERIRAASMVGTTGADRPSWMLNDGCPLVNQQPRILPDSSSSHESTASCVRRATADPAGLHFDRAAHFM
jgi:hypothetical protein